MKLSRYYPYWYGIFILIEYNNDEKGPAFDLPTFSRSAGILYSNSIRSHR
jgi:hypothetical protein